ncbi:MAG: hypothetical protein ACREC0_05290 [Methylocella sp.]
MRDAKVRASSASDFAPLLAVKATFPLNAGAWCRRDRCVIVTPDMSGQAFGVPPPGAKAPEGFSEGGVM